MSEEKPFEIYTPEPLIIPETAENQMESRHEQELEGVGVGEIENVANELVVEAEQVVGNLELDSDGEAEVAEALGDLKTGVASAKLELVGQNPERDKKRAGLAKIMDKLHTTIRREETTGSQDSDKIWKKSLRSNARMKARELGIIDSDQDHERDDTRDKLIMATDMLRRVESGQETTGNEYDDKKWEKGLKSIIQRCRKELGIDKDENIETERDALSIDRGEAQIVELRPKLDDRERKRLFSGAKSFDQLITSIKENNVDLQGSRESFQADDLVDIINRIRKREFPLGSATSNCGFRVQVERLLYEDDDLKILKDAKNEVEGYLLTEPIFGGGMFGEGDPDHPANKKRRERKRWRERVRTAIEKLESTKKEELDRLGGIYDGVMSGRLTEDDPEVKQRWLDKLSDRISTLKKEIDYKP